MDNDSVLFYGTEILGAFSKLRRATVSFVMNVRLSVLMEKVGFHWTNSNKIWHWRIFRKSVDRNQVTLRSENNNSTLHEYLCTFIIKLIWILLRMRNVSDKSCRKNKKTHYVFNNSKMSHPCCVYINNRCRMIVTTCFGLLRPSSGFHPMMATIGRNI